MSDVKSVDRTALKMALDRVGMPALADEVDRMTPLAVAQLARLRRNAYLEIKIPRWPWRR